MAINSGPAVGAEEVDVSAADDTLDQESRGIYVGTSGDLKVDMADGSTVTFTSLAAGVIHPLRVVKVYMTGTTAGSIIAVY